VDIRRAGGVKFPVEEIVAPPVSCLIYEALSDADEAQIEASFGAAIRIAREQKSISLEKWTEATWAEYHRQKASGSGGRAFRLPLW
jgi:hypothetical protein